MRSALVLNATYEPLSVVSARRAICLVLCDKADVVADDGTEIHSEKLSMAGPIVIRLRYVVKVPYHRHTAMSRRAVFARDNHRCGYCGETADSIDHVMPRSRGLQKKLACTFLRCLAHREKCRGLPMPFHAYQRSGSRSWLKQVKYARVVR